jgi:putative DNA primase/helicase
MSSLERTLLDFGIDPRAVDLGLVDTWQYLPTDDKPGRRNGHVLVKPDGAVIVCNMRTDERTVWQPDKGPPAVPISRRRGNRDDIDRARQRKKREQADAADLATRVWKRAKPAGADHPYLRRKGLPPLDLKETDCINGWRCRWLVTPLYSSDPLQAIRNLEAINERGDKRPIRGALRSGTFGFAGPGMPTDTVVIAEGWSTAAALHVALSIPVVFATSKSNLPRVAEIWRVGLPNARIIIAADNDPDGGGIDYAHVAGRLAGVTVRAPAQPGDWHDVFAAEGAAEIRRLWQWPE